MEVLNKIAAAIVSKLPAQLSYEPRALPKRPETQSGAYNLYLKGRFYSNKRTESAVRRSIELFEEALQIDPGCALAHAGLADALNILATYNYARPLDAYPKAKAAAARALELEKALAQAHCASLAPMRSMTGIGNARKRNSDEPFS